MVFLTDGTAAATQQMHDSSLSNLAYGFAKLMTCREVEIFLMREEGGDRQGGEGKEKKRKKKGGEVRSEN